MFLLLIAHSKQILWKYYLKQHFCLSLKINNDFSVVHIPLMHLHWLWLRTFHISLCRTIFSLVFILLSVVYIWPGPNDFYFFKSKSTTPWTMFIKSWTFWTVVANARAKENWVLLNDGYAESLLIENSVSF